MPGLQRPCYYCRKIRECKTYHVVYVTSPRIPNVGKLKRVLKSNNRIRKREGKFICESCVSMFKTVIQIYRSLGHG